MNPWNLIISQLEQKNNSNEHTESTVHHESWKTKCQRHWVKSTGVTGVYQVSYDRWEAKWFKKGKMGHLYCGHDFEKAVASRKEWEAANRWKKA